MTKGYCINDKWWVDSEWDCCTVGVVKIGRLEGEHKIEIKTVCCNCDYFRSMGEVYRELGESKKKPKKNKRRRSKQ